MVHYQVARVYRLVVDSAVLLVVGAVFELFNILLEIFEPNFVNDGIIGAHQVWILRILDDLRNEDLAAAIRLQMMHLLQREL